MSDICDAPYSKPRVMSHCLTSNLTLICGGDLNPLSGVPVGPPAST